MVYEITGDGFLRHMVRAIAGTLVEIGRGRGPVSGCATCWRRATGDSAGPTAPARGLFLVGVEYRRLIMSGMSLEQLLASIPPGSPDEALARQVDFDRLPAHVAIIMDGNGRWAAQRHLPRVEGHRAGIDSVRDVVETSARLGIGVLTLYAFSMENWKRPRDRGQHADDAAEALSAARAQHAAQEQHPIPRHRPRRRAAARRAVRARDARCARPTATAGCCSTSR